MFWPGWEAMGSDFGERGSLQLPTDEAEKGPESYLQYICGAPFLEMQSYAGSSRGSGVTSSISVASAAPGSTQDH